MIIKILWEEKISKDLFLSVQSSIEELWLSDFIVLEKIIKDEELKNELGIKEEPALIIVEDSIDFKDVIFEWITPDEEEIKSMLLSIIGGWDGWGCSTESGCGTCSSGC